MANYVKTIVRDADGKERVEKIPCGNMNEMALGSAKPDEGAPAAAEEKPKPEAKKKPSFKPKFGKRS